MMIKLDLYRVFCEVAKFRSFSKAAAALYMTQPAVSQSMLQLERELDVRLFIRTPRGVVLTNEGQLLHEYVSSAMSLIGTGEDKLSEIKNLLAGELKIGVGDTTSRYYLLPYLEKFHNRYSNIRLRIFNGTTIELCSMLKAGEIDMALCNLPVEDPALEIVKCMEVHDIFVCGDRYRRGIKKALSLSEIAEYPLILLETKSNSRNYVEGYMASRGVVVRPEIELGSHDLLLEFAKINLGIACVIKEFSRDYLEKGTVHEIRLTEEIPPRSIGLCFLKSIALSPAAVKFAGALELMHA
ncbi:MAG TPA: LysR family transcriptional regulator [Clostridia bacterium]|nr:LysR family transcriptional regulator [Clostridia bacterium]